MSARAEMTSAKRFGVATMQSDGRERVFRWYGERSTAEDVAALLNSLGCPARVIADDAHPIQ